MIVEVTKRIAKIEVLIGPRGRTGASAWDDITGKPSTFTPSAHAATHTAGGADEITVAQSQVTGLAASLSGKSNTGHTHAQSDVTGLVADLAGKSNVGHTHAQSDVTGLSSALAAKADLVDGLVPTNQIPAIAITEFLGTASSQSAMLALTGQRGDWCNRSDVHKAYVAIAEPLSSVNNWVAIDYPAAPVLSVNGQAGTVVLGKADVELGNVENTALSTWAGTTNVTTLGTIATGTWQGTAIADSYIASAATWNAKQAALASGSGTNKFLTWGLSSWAPTSTASVRDLIMPGAPSPVSSPYAWAWDGNAYGWTSLSINALVPAQTGNSGKFLTTDGSVVSWGSVSTGLTIGSTVITGGTSGRLLTSGGTVGELTLGTGVSTALGNSVNASSGLLTYGIIGTSGATLPLLNTANTWSAAQAITLTALGTTSAAGVTLANSTAAANGAQQVSPGMSLIGNAWNTSASVPLEWNFYELPVQAATPTSQLILRHRVNSGSWVNSMVLNSPNDSSGTVMTLSSTYGSTVVTVGGGGSTRITNLSSTGWGSFQIDGGGGNASLLTTAATDFSLAPVAGVFSQRNSTTAQAFRVMNTYASSTSYESAVLDWKTTSNTLRLGSDIGSGGGTARDVALIRGGAVVQTLGANTNDDAKPRKLPSYIVSGIPSASTCGAGAMAFVTDATSTTAYTTVAGGGTNKVLVISDGSNWIIH